MSAIIKDYQYVDGLESERLITRFLRENDWKVWRKFYDHEGIDQFLPHYDTNDLDERAQRWVDFQLKRYADRLFGMQWIILKDTNEIVGQCGLLIQDVNGTKELEVGYSFMKPYWGKGYASEAAQLFRNYGFETFDVQSIISLIDPENHHSQGVATRNGMTKGPLVDWKGYQLNVWRITRAEWESR